MTAPHIVDPARLLDQAVSDASPDLMRHLLSTVINALLSAEADAVCGAEYGQASPERLAQRNGYRHRDLDLRTGTIDVAIPKLRSGSYFPDWLLERRKRAESALISVVATCYLLGVSTRRMDKLVQSLGITSLSKSQVSRMAADLDEQVTAFRTRSLAESGPFTFVAADALTMKVRENGRVVNAVVLVATGINVDGHREVLGHQGRHLGDRCRPGTGSSPTSSPAVCPGCCWSPPTPTAGLVEAIAANLPGTTWQRCRTHYAANLMSVCPKSSWGWVKALLHSVYDQPDADAVHAQYDRILDALTDKLPAVADHLDARPRRRARVHPLPEGDLASDLVQQPPGAAEPGDPPPHRRGRDLPRPRRRHPPRRRRPRRATRRMGRRPPLPRPRRPHPSPHHRHPSRTDSRRAARAGGRRMTRPRDIYGPGHHTDPRQRGDEPPL